MGEGGYPLWITILIIAIKTPKLPLPTYIWRLFYKEKYKNKIKGRYLGEIFSLWLATYCTKKLLTKDRKVVEMEKTIKGRYFGEWLIFLFYKRIR